jgi:hypothetical protein
MARLISAGCDFACFKCGTVEKAAPAHFVICLLVRSASVRSHSRAGSGCQREAPQRCIRSGGARAASQPLTPENGADASGEDDCPPTTATVHIGRPGPVEGVRKRRDRATALSEDISCEKIHGYSCRGGSTSCLGRAFS